MEATVVVLVLVGLVIPIVLILSAILLDVVVFLWAAYRVWHDRLVPSVIRVVRVHPIHFRTHRPLHR